MSPKPNVKRVPLTLKPGFLVFVECGREHVPAHTQALNRATRLHNTMRSIVERRAAKLPWGMYYVDSMARIETIQEELAPTLERAKNLAALLWVEGMGYLNAGMYWIPVTFEDPSLCHRVYRHYLDVLERLHEAIVANQNRSHFRNLFKQYTNMTLPAMAYVKEINEAISCAVGCAKDIVVAQGKNLPPPSNPNLVLLERAIFILQAVTRGE